MQTTDYFGNVTTYRYDLNNRMRESKMSKNGLDEIMQFTYDNNGNMYSSSKGIGHPEGGGARLGIVDENAGSTLGDMTFCTFNELNQLIGYKRL